MTADTATASAFFISILLAFLATSKVYKVVCFKSSRAQCVYYQYRYGYKCNHEYYIPLFYPKSVVTASSACSVSS